MKMFFEEKRLIAGFLLLILGALLLASPSSIFGVNNVFYGGGGLGSCSFGLGSSIPSSCISNDTASECTQTASTCGGTYLANNGTAYCTTTNKNCNHAIVFFISGTLTVSNPAGNINIQSPFALSCTSLTGKVNTAPAGASLIFTINRNGASIGTVTIIAGTTGASTTISATTLAQDDVITVQITQIGSSTAGSDLIAEVRCLG